MGSEMCIRDRLITRREFIYRTINPSAKDNPYNAVLRGYVTRIRDDEIARLQRVDFLSGAMVEEVSKYKKDNNIADEKLDEVEIVISTSLTAKREKCSSCNFLDN